MTTFCLNFVKWRVVLLLALILPLFIASCDDGHVDDPVYVDTSESYSVQIIGTFSGVDQWNDESYSLVVAAYDDESLYSLIQKSFPLNGDASTVDTITISRVTTAATSIQVAVADVLRQRVATIYSYDIPEGQDPSEAIVLNVGALDASPFGAVDAAVFQGLSCARCHQGDEPPAGLDLTTDNALVHLVGVKSHKEPDETLVVAGDADNSFLVKVLEQGDDNVHYDHRAFFVEDSRAPLLSLIRSWINSIEPDEN